MTTDEDMKKIVEKLSKNPKIKKAFEGLLAPLQQDGDSLTIEIPQPSPSTK